MSDFGLGLIMDGGRSSHLPTRACRNGRCSPDLSSIRSWSASESSSCCGVWGVECGVLCFVTAHLSSKVNLPQAIDLRRKFGHATPHNLGGTKPSKSTVWDWVWDRSEMLAAIHRQSIDPAAGPCRQFPARARARERERGRGRERERERESKRERENLSWSVARERGKLGHCCRYLLTGAPPIQHAAVERTCNIYKPSDARSCDSFAREGGGYSRSLPARRRSRRASSSPFTLA